MKRAATGFADAFLPELGLCQPGFAAGSGFGKLFASQGRDAMTCRFCSSGLGVALAGSCQTTRKKCRMAFRRDGTAEGVALDEGRKFMGTWTARQDRLAVKGAVKAELSVLGPWLGGAMAGSAGCESRRLAR